VIVPSVTIGYYSGQYKYTDEYGYSNYNETYNNGYYYIDYVYNYGYDQGFGIGESNIYLTNYTDWGYDYDGLGTASFTTTYNVSSYEGYSGLGSEYGYAYNSCRFSILTVKFKFKDKNGDSRIHCQGGIALSFEMRWFQTLKAKNSNEKQIAERCDLLNACLYNYLLLL